LTGRLFVSAALVAGLTLLVATLGLQATAADVTALLRKPSRLMRSLAAMLIVMPLVALVVASTFDLDRAVKIALVALALSPMPPFLPSRTIAGGGAPSYAIGLLVATGLISIVYVPLSLAIIERVLDIPSRVSVTHLIVPIGWSVCLPLVGGLVVNRIAPAMAARIAGPAGRLASLLLLLGLIPLTAISFMQFMPLVGNGTVLAMLVVCVAGLAVGHALGEGEPADRATLALSTAARHPGVAMAIANVNFPDQTLVLPVVLTYVILTVVASVPYSKWAARRPAVAAAAGQGSQG
jgi:BASS family bile acid:Na+ symporter